MTKYYLIYGWDLAKRQIIPPTIKEDDSGDVYLNLPERTGYKFIKCFCSKDRKEVEEWLEKTREPFVKSNISYLNETIKKMEKLCKLQEEKIANEGWKDVKWPMDDLPF